MKRILYFLHFPLLYVVYILADDMALYGSSLVKMSMGGGEK